jgi:predicted lipid-binding transport protein (Tim44 family)
LYEEEADMKKFVATMVLAITAVSMIAEATARPMGSKRSIGRQSQAVKQMQAPAPAPTPGFQQQRAPAAVPATAGAAGAAAAAQAKRPSMWKGILGGALLGLGLGALLSHFGIGGALASAISAILMIGLLALAVLFIVRMFRRKDTPANPAFGGGYTNPVPAGASPNPAAGSVATPEIGSGLRQPAAFQGQQSGQSGNVNLGKPGAGAAPAMHQQWGVPADFDQDAFLRHAKASFIRMQSAWDRGDVNDLREFTSPEVYGELSMQIQERGGNPDFTDVVSIDAQLLGIETTERDYLASVQFNGMMRNAPNALAEPFVEVWNLSKPLSGNGGWVLAGIQQIT